MKILMKKYKYKLKDLLVCLVFVCLNPCIQVEDVLGYKNGSSHKHFSPLCRLSDKNEITLILGHSSPQTDGRTTSPDKKKHRKQVMWFSVPGSSVY